MFGFPAKVNWPVNAITSRNVQSSGQQIQSVVSGFLGLAGPTWRVPGKVPEQSPSAVTDFQVQLCFPDVGEEP